MSYRDNLLELAEGVKNELTGNLISGEVEEMYNLAFDRSNSAQDEIDSLKAENVKLRAELERLKGK
jgi:cell division protein FtsB